MCAFALLSLFVTDQQIPPATWVLRRLALGSMTAHKSVTNPSLYELNLVHTLLGYVAFCFVMFLLCHVLEKVGLTKELCKSPCWHEH